MWAISALGSIRSVAMTPNNSINRHHFTSYVSSTIACTSMFIFLPICLPLGFFYRFVSISDMSIISFHFWSLICEVYLIQATLTPTFFHAFFIFVRKYITYLKGTYTHRCAVYFVVIITKIWASLKIVVTGAMSILFNSTKCLFYSLCISHYRGSL